MFRKENNWTIKSRAFTIIYAILASWLLGIIVFCVLYFSDLNWNKEAKW
jgi:hypothetical protein